MKLEAAREIAEDLLERLKPGCEIIRIVGSTRRLKPYPNDIELLVVPRYSSMVDLLDREIQKLVFEKLLDFRLNKRGRRAYGPKNKMMVHVPSGIGVDIFSTTEECWPMSLVIRTGGERTNKKIAWAAINKGWHLQAYGSGYSTPEGDIACSSERDVFEMVGLQYQEPWDRE